MGLCFMLALGTANMPGLDTLELHPMWVAPLPWYHLSVGLRRTKNQVLLICKCMPNWIHAPPAGHLLDVWTLASSRRHEPWNQQAHHHQDAVSGGPWPVGACQAKPECITNI
jgi:hypothetical protein